MGATHVCPAGHAHFILILKNKGAAHGGWPRRGENYFRVFDRYFTKCALFRAVECADFDQKITKLYFLGPWSVQNLTRKIERGAIFEDWIIY